MKRITLQLRPDQHEQLKELACPGRSIASLVRQALDEFLKNRARGLAPLFLRVS